MTENTKEHGFIGIIKEGLSFVSQIITASIVPPIANGAEIIMKTIDDKLIKMEKRIMRRIYSSLVIGLGILFLIFALFFFLIEFLGWSNAVAFFFIGMIIFVTGLFLKIGDSNK